MRSKIFKVNEIAKAAGVSPATVSRVINHRELVKQNTIDKVESAMLELGYDLGAITVKKIDKKILLVHLPRGNNAFYEQILQGIITLADAQGYNIILSHKVISNNTIDEFIQLLRNVNACGIILLSRLPLNLLNALHTICPIVQCCEYNEESELPYVTIDDYAAAKSATNFLISAGRNKIAFLNGPKEFHYSRARLAGFQDTLAEHDLSIPSSWIMQVPQINYDMAYSMVNQLLSSEQLPNAIFAASDVMAAAAINAARKNRFKVPRDIMIMGFDNIDICQITRPTITTVSQPTSQIGYTACELLLERINGEEQLKSMKLPTELIIRESAVANVLLF